jgi:hypothetical protein
MKKLNDFLNKTDLEILEVYKNNSHWSIKQKIESYLYKKYSPLCKKYSYAYRYLSSMEDNMQECYFLMLKAIDFVNVNKINNESSFSFGFIFKSYIEPHFKYKGIKYIKEVSNTDYFYKINYIEYNKITKMDSFENSLIFNINLEIFKKQLTPYELNLLELLQTSMKKQDIAKELGEKHTANLSYWRTKIQSKCVEFMNNAGYELTV